MKINMTSETLFLEDGTYTGVVLRVSEYQKSDTPCVAIEINLADNTHFLSFVENAPTRLGQYPWNVLFKVLGSEETDELVGKSVTFEVKNSVKNGTTYTNIKKINLN